MGDIADDLISEGLDSHWNGDDEWDDNYENPFYKPKTKTCYRCGETGLRWGGTPKGWRLFASNGTMHSCDKPKKAHKPQHWKVGDRMGENEETFVIGSMRLVEIDATQKIFDLEYYDEEGTLQGTQRLQSIDRDDTDDRLQVVRS